MKEWWGQQGAGCIVLVLLGLAPVFFQWVGWRVCQLPPAASKQRHGHGASKSHAMPFLGVLWRYTAHPPCLFLCDNTLATCPASSFASSRWNNGSCAIQQHPACRKAKVAFALQVRRLRSPCVAGAIPNLCLLVPGTACQPIPLTLLLPNCIE